MSNLLLINGKALKNPYPVFKVEEEQFVNSARNANGTLTSTIINRRLNKFSGLVWKGLTRAEWKAIRTEVEGFYCNVTYFDTVADEVITRPMYFGNSSYEVLDWDRSGDIMIPKRYKECAVNIIDTGN